jgi:hopanoid biosynthesis associated protein HpnK
MPKLRVGLHLVLTDGMPVLSPDRIPDLVDDEGRLRTNMVSAGAQIFLRPRVRRQVREEIEAQFAAYANTGLTLDHVNSHHHFHLHPTVGAEVVRAAARYGGCGVRVPQEPRATLRRIDSTSKPPSDLLTGPWAALLRARVDRHRLRAPERVFGLSWSGAMTQGRLLSLLQHLPEGTTEIYLHPATTNAFAEAAPGYRYAEELSALLAPDVIAAIRTSRARVGGFRDLP